MSAAPVPLRHAIIALLRDPLDGVLARSILGTDDPEAIASRIEAYARAELGRAVVGCTQFIQSVGAVFALVLDDGEHVVLKAHGPDETRWGATAGLPSLRAVYGVQAALARQGFPCADVVRPPVQFGPGVIAAMTHLPEPPREDPHLPAVGRAMAAALADVARRLAPFRDTPDLPVASLPSDRLWPRPHNALFRMDAPGGEWVDERARAAREVLDAAPPPLAIAHTDWSAANVRVSGGRVTAVYDMDSVALTDEMRSLASIAVHYTYTGEEGSRWPSREEACTFVADYERERGRTLTAAERELLDAGAIYALAYTVRTGMSLGGEEEKEGAGGIVGLLRAAPARGYFG